MTLTMYNDSYMLQKVCNDLSGFLRLVNNRLREVNASDNALDVWGAAKAQLENLDEAEKECKGYILWTPDQLENMYKLSKPCLVDGSCKC